MPNPDPTLRDRPSVSFPTDAEVADQVFITPRVLDQGAFREYADSLRGLIKEAGGRRAELRSDSEQARQLGENLAEAANRLRERLETTAKLLPTLDNRVRRAEQALEQAIDTAKIPDQLEQRISAHFEQMEQRVMQAVAQAEQRLSAIESRYAQITEQVEQNVARLESVRAELEVAAEAAQNHLDNVTARADAFAAHLDECADRSAARFEEKTETLAARADHAYAQLNDGVTEILAGADRQIAGLEAKLAPFAARADDLAALLDSHVTRAVETIDTHAADALKRVRAIEMLSARAVRLLGFDPDNPAEDIAPDSLMMLIQRGDELERAARQTALQLQDLHHTSDAVRNDLARSLDQSLQSIDALAARRDEIINDMNAATAALRTHHDEQLEQLLDARKQIEAIEEKRALVEVGVSDVCEDLARLESAVAHQLADLRTQAADELARLQQAVASQMRSLSQIFPQIPKAEGDVESANS